jgi:hypothetical protein
MRRTIGIAVIALALTTSTLTNAPAAHGCPHPAAPAAAPAWPPPPAPGSFDIAHFGEAHYNEGQGPLTVPLLVQDLIAYDPDLVAFSSDMADVGNLDRMTCFEEIMSPLQQAGIPWYDSPGNHDRTTIGNTFGGVLADQIGPWRTTFADAPAPWGDGPLPPGVSVPAGEDNDGAGAATHYYLDYKQTRLIVLDNSRHSFGQSDVDQYPAVGPLAKDASQLAFLHRTAQDAREKGLLAFVMMHQPTQDPRDQTYAYPISYNHTMSKGATPDNQAFDALAVATEVDAVLIGHILGNAQYEVADVPYFIDGGGGGSPYTRDRTGVDTGYYYAYRLLRVHDDGFRTYVVPLVDHLEVTAPATAMTGSEITLAATAVQPFDPSLPPRFPLMPQAAIRVELRPPAPSLLDRGVPAVAYMWSSSDASVLRPVPGALDDASDPAFDATTMTTSGRFTAVGPGTATITISTGTHSASVTITVA